MISQFHIAEGDVLKVKAEDQQEFITQLYAENAEFLIRLCYKRTGYDPRYKDIIDDCMQETFLAAFLAYSDLIQHENPRGWLALTCMHRLLYALRREKTRKWRMAAMLSMRKAEGIPDCSTTENKLEQEAIHNYLQELRSELSTEESMIFDAYFCHCQTMQTIAASQKIETNRVKTIVRRIRKKAIKIFENQFYTSF